MKSRWLDHMALRSLFDPEMRLPRLVVDRIVKVMEDQLAQQRRECEAHVRRLRWVVFVQAIAVIVVIVVITVRL